MEEERDPFDFALAENLHMTVEQLETTMTNDEYLWWRAFYVWREAQRKLAE